MLYGNIFLVTEPTYSPVPGSISIRVDRLLRFFPPVVPPEERRRLSALAIRQIVTRVASGRNVHDQPAKAYSKRRVYIPITGAGRTKTILGGREVFTPKDVLAMRRAGTLSGQTTKSRKSMVFANRSEYKRSKGKSGRRDLQESGRMLNAIGIISADGRIGFLREEEHRKALGNQRVDPWFGLSPNDRAAVLAEIKSVVDRISSKMTA